MVSNQQHSYDTSEAKKVSKELRDALREGAPQEKVTRLTHSLADSVVAAVLKANPGASCKAGCGACCRQSLILIERADAELLSKESGRPISFVHTKKNWKGVSCTFFDSVTASCSVYEHRPLSCRASISYDCPTKCESEVTRQMIIQDDFYRELLALVGPDCIDAWRHSRGADADADIRDFFPPE